MNDIIEKYEKYKKEGEIFWPLIWKIKLIGEILSSEKQIREKHTTFAFSINPVYEYEIL